ncbi:hypothetical protein [Desulfosporosinus sp. SB140]|uniref:hypothetical protein n=1 Tax=Desulfosporosinus paludis TaxID=3115649 RepID=UPI00389024DA
MSNLKQFTTDDETVEILKLSRIEGKTLFLPDITLERSQYETVNKVLVALGAKWNKKARGHVFDYDIHKEIESVIKTKTVTDWKKSTDFFYTPKNVVNEMLGQINFYRHDNMKILEPSAGQGHILDLAKENFPNAEFIVIEKNPHHCERLREKGYFPIQADFMDVEPVEVDAVLMNPPFSFEIEHITHAYDFLKDGGQLITIASAGILDKGTKKGKEFKQWFDDVYGYDYTLPANSFKESGTSVNTKMLIFNK